MSLDTKYRPINYDDVLGQDATKTILRRIVAKGHGYHQSYLFAGKYGGGKCLGKGTPIVMFDGSLKNVEDIVVGDRIMGPDSEPRNILSLARGRERMFRVRPVKGEPYVVNESHILSLVMSTTSCGHLKDEIVNIPVRDFLKMPKTFQKVALGYHANAINFDSQEVPLDPYILGVWLGDGHTNMSRVTTADEEIRVALEDFASQNQITHLSDTDKNQLKVKFVQKKSAATTWSVTTGRLGGLRTTNPLIAALKQLCVYGHKHIPQCYKSNTKEVRLALLAGLIDTDGYMHHNNFVVTSSIRELAEDIALVARSLGFAAHIYPRMKACTNVGYKKMCPAFEVSISGPTDTIPTKLARKKAVARQQVKNVLRSRITLEDIGIGDYYGFEIDGDHLFLLGDFTVTHNTTCARILARALLCESPSNGDPCNKCDMCIQMLNGTCDSFCEFDAASRSSKEDMKALVETLNYSTFSGSRRIYLIDEAHALSSAALDVLLLPMEEPIPGTDDHKLVCLFCTTEPDKLRDAVISRCAPAFVIDTVTTSDVSNRLEWVCTQEGFSFEKDALDLIAEVSDGHIRNALKSLEAASALGFVNKDSVVKYLRLDVRSTHQAILAAMVTGQSDEAVKQAISLLERQSPAMAYQELSSLAMAVWGATKGLPVKGVWDKAFVADLATKADGNLLLSLVSRFSSRPSKPSASMLLCDIASGLSPVSVSVVHNVVQMPTTTVEKQTTPPPTGGVPNLSIRTPAVETSSAGKVDQPGLDNGVWVDPRGKRSKTSTPPSAEQTQLSVEEFSRLLRMRMVELDGSERHPVLGHN